MRELFRVYNDYSIIKDNVEYIMLCADHTKHISEIANTISNIDLALYHVGSPLDLTAIYENLYEICSNKSFKNKECLTSIVDTLYDDVFEAIAYSINMDYNLAIYGDSKKPILKKEYNENIIAASIIQRLLIPILSKIDNAVLGLMAQDIEDLFKNTLMVVNKKPIVECKGDIYLELRGYAENVFGLYIEATRSYWDQFDMPLNRIFSRTLDRLISQLYIIGEKTNIADHITDFVEDSLKNILQYIIKESGEGDYELPWMLWANYLYVVKNEVDGFSKRHIAESLFEYAVTNRNGIKLIKNMIKKHNLTEYFN